MKDITGVPFLDCIPIAHRGTVIEKLAEFQKRKYDTELEVVTAIRAGSYPFLPAVTIDAAEYEESQITEVNQEMAHNADIKARVK